MIFLKIAFLVCFFPIAFTAILIAGIVFKEVGWIYAWRWLCIGSIFFGAAIIFLEVYK